MGYGPPSHGEVISEKLKEAGGQWTNFKGSFHLEILLFFFHWSMSKSISISFKSFFFLFFNVFASFSELKKALR